MLPSGEARRAIQNYLSFVSLAAAALSDGAKFVTETLGSGRAGGRRSNFAARRFQGYSAACGARSAAGAEDTLETMRRLRDIVALGNSTVACNPPGMQVDGLNTSSRPLSGRLGEEQTKE